MLRRVLGLVLFLAAAAWPQTAELSVFIAAMSPANETPPIVGLDASGTGVLWVHTVRDATGQIISGSVDFNVAYNFPGAITLQGLHIHTGAAGVMGGVIIGTDLGTGARAIVDETGRGIVRRQVQVTPDNAGALAALRGLFTNPEGYYVNLHTSVNPGGAIRGQAFPAEWTVLLGAMNPREENPPITDLNASGVGSITAVRAIDSRGRLVAGFVEFDVDYSFPEAVMFTGLHIHGGPRGVNAGVLLNTGLRATPSGAGGTGTFNFGVEVSDSNAGAAGGLHGLFDNPEAYYVNLHTTVYTNGAIRAQLKRAETARLRFTMSSANEVPPIAGLDAVAYGLLDIRLLRDATGAATAGRVTFDINHRFPGQTEFIGLHVHNERAGANAGVSIGTDLGSGARAVVSETGFGNISRRVHVSSGTALAALNSLLSNPENHYANLHTSVNGSGAARAQLAPARATNPAIRAVISSVSDPSLRTVALGGTMTIFGTDFSKVPTDLGGVVGESIPTTANGTSVTIGGRAAPLVAIGNEPGLNPPDYVVAQVPFDTPAGSQQVVVRNSNGASQAFNVTVASVAPGTYFDGTGAIVLKVPDLSLVRPNNAAVANDTLAIIMTGLGQTTPGLQTGQLAPFTGTYSVANPVVTIGGQAATIVGAAALPGFLGTYAVVVRMPSGVSAGSAAVVVRAGDVAANTTSIAVR